jgi:hypothetical protein
VTLAKWKGDVAGMTHHLRSIASQHLQIFVAGELLGNAVLIH